VLRRSLISRGTLCANAYTRTVCEFIFFQRVTFYTKTYLYSFFS
jgi:hypothetical protein